MNPRDDGAPPFHIRTDLRPGDLGRIVALHGTAYEALDGFGLRFEAYVTSTVAEYVLDNDARGRIWLADRDERLAGCAAIAELWDGPRTLIRMEKPLYPTPGYP